MHVFHNFSISYFTQYGNHWIFVALLVIWVSGFLFCGMQNCIKDRSVLRRLRTTSSLCKDRKLLDLQMIFEKELGIRKSVRVWQSDMVDVPFAAGICCREIYFPQVSLDEEKMSLMLQHELIHCRRKDPLYRWMIFWIGSLYWFVPFPRRLARYYTEINEISCDDRVLERRTKRERYLYAKTLADLAQRESFLKNVVSLTGHTESQLERRLEHMIKKKCEKGKMAAVMMVVLCTGICPLTTLAASAGMSRLQDVITQEVFMEDHEEIMVTGNVLEEETDVVEDFEMIPAEMQVQPRANNWIDQDISGRVSLGKVTVSANNKIKFYLTGSPSDISFSAGYINSSGTRTYVTTSNGEIDHTFTISKAGTYELFVDSTTGKVVHIQGSITIIYQ